MRVLVLAGTGEARALVKGLQGAGHSVVASLSGATRMPADLGCETRTGGFGGDEGFRDWLTKNPVDLVVDATHPFAHRVSLRTFDICKAQSTPYLQILREEWTPTGEDNWVFLDHPEEASHHISAKDVVFLATGRQTLRSFADVTAKHLYCRQIDPPDGPFPFAKGEFIIGRPPFSQDSEEALFKKLGITCLVVKNAGGDASRTKLDAARALGMRVLMINRPLQPAGEKAQNVSEALRKVANLAHH